MSLHISVDSQSELFVNSSEDLRCQPEVSIRVHISKVLWTNVDESILNLYLRLSLLHTIVHGDDPILVQLTILRNGSIRELQVLNGNQDKEGSEVSNRVWFESRRISVLSEPVSEGHVHKRGLLLSRSIDAQSHHDSIGINSISGIGTEQRWFGDRAKSRSSREMRRALRARTKI